VFLPDGVDAVIHIFVLGFAIGRAYNNEIAALKVTSLKARKSMTTCYVAWAASSFACNRVQGRPMTDVCITGLGHPPVLTCKEEVVLCVFHSCGVI